MGKGEENGGGDYCGNPFASTADWHPRDQLLRSYGWRIVARPKDKKATWEKGGRVLSEREALEEVRAERGAARQ